MGSRSGSRALAAGILVGVAALVPVGPSNAGTPGHDPGLAVEQDGQRVVVRDGSTKHKLDVSDLSDWAELKETKLLLAVRKGSVRYLVLALGGPSKFPGDGGQCGSGWERRLVWLEVGIDWQIRAQQDELYDSCWQDMEGNYQVAGTILTAEWRDARDVRRSLRYDASTPEQWHVSKLAAGP